MAMLRILFIAMATIFLIEGTMALNHAVGAPRGGWDLTTNLTAWASTQTFTKGDKLIFSYNPSFHNVLEVTKTNYDTCAASNANKKYTTGKDIIVLSSVGTKYFICGIPGHCAAGMKVQIDTVAAPAPAPGTSPTAAAAPSSPSTSPRISPSISVAPATSPTAAAAPSSPSTSPRSVAAPPSDSPGNKPIELTPSTQPIELSPLPAPHSGADGLVRAMNSAITFAFGFSMLMFFSL